MQYLGGKIERPNHLFRSVASCSHKHSFRFPLYIIVYAMVPLRLGFLPGQLLEKELLFFLCPLAFFSNFLNIPFVGFKTCPSHDSHFLKPRTGLHLVRGIWCSSILQKTILDILLEFSTLGYSSGTTKKRTSAGTGAFPPRR